LLPLGVRQDAPLRVKSAHWRVCHAHWRVNEFPPSSGQ